MRETGLQLNVNNYEFKMNTTKYLGFITKMGKNIIINTAKVEIIVKLEAFETVKGVQKFLGFADFYRKFIKKIPAGNAFNEFNEKKKEIRLVRSNERSFFEIETNFRDRFFIFNSIW